ncbi:MAG TPA: oligosaccharide flippase family protein [Chitinophagaceae bacterium]
MTAIRKNLLLRNFFSLGFVQVISSLLQLLVIPYVIAKIGVANFGVVAVAQVVMYYMATFTDYGFNQTATREVSLNRSDMTVLSSVFFRVIAVKIILCCIAFVILLLLALIFQIVRENFLLYCLAFLFVPGYASHPAWFLQGVERMQLIAFTTLTARVIFVILVFIFISGPEHSRLFIFFMGVGNLVAGVMCILIVFRKFRLSYRRPSPGEILEEIKRGWPVTVTNLSMNIIQYGNLFILRLFTNDIAAGYFSVAERIYFTMKQGLTIFSQSVYPRVCLLAENAPGQLQSFFRRVFNPFFILVILGSAVVFALSPFILPFFVKEEGIHSVFILRMLCIALPVICLNIPSTLSLLAFDRRKTYFAVYTSAMALSIVSNIILASFFESTGTISAIFITEIFITTTVFLAMKRFSLNNFKERDKLNT